MLMKRIFEIKYLFLWNGIIEMLGGVVILLYPKIILLGADHTTESLAAGKMYGLAAFILGVISFQCFKFYTNNNGLFKIIILSFIAFHLLISFQMYGAFTHDIVKHPGPFTLHLVLAIWFGIGVIMKKEETKI